MLNCGGRSVVAARGLVVDEALGELYKALEALMVGYGELVPYEGKSKELEDWLTAKVGTSLRSRSCSILRANWWAPVGEAVDSLLIDRSENERFLIVSRAFSTHSTARAVSCLGDEGALLVGIAFWCTVKDIGRQRRTQGCLGVKFREHDLLRREVFIIITWQTAQSQKRNRSYFPSASFVGVSAVRC